MKQGEIWLINLDPSIGAEIKKTRPAIIVNDDSPGRLPLKIIVPLSDWKERYSTASWMVLIAPDHENQLHKSSAADCFQVRSISEERFVRKLGEVDSATWKEFDMLSLLFSQYNESRYELIMMEFEWITIHHVTFNTDL